MPKRPTPRREKEDIVQLSRRIYRTVKRYRQQRMQVPTDPEEIHRRADEIRARLARERQEQRERDRIREDLRLIQFDLQMRGVTPQKQPPIRRGIVLLGNIILKQVRK